MVRQGLYSVTGRLYIQYLLKVNGLKERLILKECCPYYMLDKFRGEKELKYST